MEYENNTENPQIDWHSGFAGGLELSFRKYRNDIKIEREISLSKEPLRIDFMVIKKDHQLIVDNSVGRIFRKYNIIEYKNPTDTLNIDVVWKCIGYAGIYKGYAKTVNEIPDTELTISIFRNSKPVKLLEDMEQAGRVVDNPCPGIYRINGLSILPLQIVVPPELEEDDFNAIRLLMAKADKEGLVEFLKEASRYTEKEDRLNASVVLHVISAVNEDLIRAITEEQGMRDYLTILMSDEFNAAENRGRKQGRNDIIESMLRNGKTPEEISNFTGISLDTIKTVQKSMLQLA